MSEKQITVVWILVYGLSVAAAGWLAGQDNWFFLIPGAVSFVSGYIAADRTLA